MGVARNLSGEGGALVRTKAKSEGGVLWKGTVSRCQQLKGKWEHCKLPQLGSGHRPDCKCILDGSHFGHTKSPETRLLAKKCCLIHNISLTVLVKVQVFIDK